VIVERGQRMSHGTASTEVAVFIDLENLRYSLLNLYGQEPNFQAIVEKAKKYGRPSVMRAYADFSEHPPNLKQQLHVAGVEAINVSVKRIKRPGSAKAVERVKNAADMILALDAILEAADADAVSKSKTFILVSGDADYIKLVTQLRNRFGQEVVITGVPGAIGSDLVAAAGGREDHIDVAKADPVDKQELKSAIVRMVEKGCAPLKFWSVGLIDQWSQSERQAIKGTAKEKRDAIHELLTEAVFVKKEVDLAVIGKNGMATQTVLDKAKAKGLKYLE
jgi:uncharacterized LabA/DUF88 family protein